MDNFDANFMPVEIHRSGVIVRVTISILNDLITGKAIELPDFRLSDVTWNIKILKKSASSDENTDVIAIHLISKFDNDTNKWSCDARAVFKLHPIQNETQEKKSIIKCLPKQTFTNDCCEYGIENFIEWDHFVEHYVDRNKATFEMEIYANPLLQTALQDIQETGTVFHFMIKNVSTAEVSCSNEFSVRGVRWKVRAQKHNDQLAVYLCAAENDLDINWLWKTTVTFKLLPFNKNEAVEKTFGETFRWGSATWGTTLLKWADFIDPTKKYVANDCAIIFCGLIVHAPEPCWEIDP